MAISETQGSGCAAENGLPQRPVAITQDPNGQQEIADSVRKNGVAHASPPPECKDIGQASQDTYHPLLAMHQAKDSRGQSNGEGRQASKGDAAKIPTD